MFLPIQGLAHSALKEDLLIAPFLERFKNTALGKTSG